MELPDTIKLIERKTIPDIEVRESLLFMSDASLNASDDEGTNNQDALIGSLVVIFGLLFIGGFAFVYIWRARRKRGQMVANSKEEVNDSAKSKLAGSSALTTPVKNNKQKNVNKLEETANFINAQEITLQDDKSDKNKQAKIVPFENLTADKILNDQLYFDKKDESILD